MNHKDMANSIVSHLGGLENIDKAWNCMTRLRFNIENKDLVDTEAIEAIEGVLGVRYQNGQHQVIVGNDAIKIVEHIKVKETIVEEEEKKTHGIGIIFDTISGIFTPILPAIAGTGLLKAVLSLVVLVYKGAGESGVYQTFEIISDSAFYFLPFLLAWSSSKRFKVNEGLALAVAGTLMYPTLIQGGDALSFMGLSVPLIAYNGSVLPVILGVYLLKHVYNFLDKHIPSVLKGIALPMLTLSITLPFVLIFIAPAGNFLSVYLATGIDWLFINAAPVAGLIYTGLMPLIIMVGMHYAFFPTAMQSIQNVGYDLVLLPANLIHNSAQAGAAFAVGIKAKDKNIRSLAFSTGISAVFGVTEPAMYGINLRFKKPFYIVMGVSGVIGSIAVTLGLKSYSFAVPGLLSIGGYASPDGSMTNLLIAVIAYLGAFIGSFILTLMIKIDFSK
ncbi:PTS transporter subunit EIIC [Erysipelothrix urinaevulpis]|uniref:PTS transporter subunit EIIC n=1 Tax=Erysipelothrix urinaevulpis TaxID=2683717 RepID=UPI00135696A2|nr:PTS transporter subunit EIIC [Erysipelothrix urinaevulpis]